MNRTDNANFLVALRDKLATYYPLTFNYEILMLTQMLEAYAEEDKVTEEVCESLSECV
jgi:hypothetical protein